MMKRVVRVRAVRRKEAVEGEEAFVRGSVSCGSLEWIWSGGQWMEWSRRRGVKEAVVL